MSISVSSRASSTITASVQGITAEQTKAVSDSTSTTSGVIKSSVNLTNAGVEANRQAGGSGGAGGAGGASESSGSTTVAVEKLQKQLQELQKQLQQQQQQLAQVQARQYANESEKAAAMAGIQASVASISASISAVSAQLAAALKESTGSASGSMVNTSA
ncbi:hypothetical protein ACYPKM_02335 [Pseudomonas aeruginosa]